MHLLHSTKKLKAQRSIKMHNKILMTMMTRSGNMMVKITRHGSRPVLLQVRPVLLQMSYRALSGS